MELPRLPPGATYAGEHMYTLLQISLTAGIFAVTFTPAAPVFPIAIVLLVPLRLRVMSCYWAPETLKGCLPHWSVCECERGEAYD